MVPFLSKRPSLNSLITLLRELWGRSFGVQNCSYLTVEFLESVHPIVIMGKVKSSFKCFQCEKTFTTAGSLKRHQKTHSRTKSFICSQCNISCTTTYTMKIHFRHKHSGEKPHVCMYCTYASPQASNLKRHMMTHISHVSVKKYQCNQCTFKCNLRNNLKRHMMIHSRILTVSCNECNFKSISLSNLKSHMLIHTGVKSYGCSLCDYSCKIFMQNFPFWSTASCMQPVWICNNNKK